MPGRIQNFYVDISNYTVDNSIMSDCGDITFINMGDTNLTLNKGIQLGIFQSITFEANAGEVDTTRYSWVFDKPTNIDPKIVILRKKYI
jgi:hypothetical protein